MTIAVSMSMSSHVCPAFVTLVRSENSIQALLWASEDQATEPASNFEGIPGRKSVHFAFACPATFAAM